MPDIVRRTFIVHLPVDRQDLLPQFQALAAVDGWQTCFIAYDRDTGESALVCFDPIPTEGEVA